MRDGDGPTQRYDLSSLRILGSVGEPINPEAWMWYHVNIGKEKLPIVDTWWLTETGGIMISPLPYATPTKPGAASLPLPGIEAAIFNEEGVEAGPNEGGHLVIRKPWPGMLRGVLVILNDTRKPILTVTKTPTIQKMVPARMMTVISGSWVVLMM